MCQFTSRCSVGEHRPGTKCPKAGQVAGVLPDESATYRTASQAAARPERFRGFGVPAAISLADLGLLAVLLNHLPVVEAVDPRLGPAALLALLTIPLILAAWLTRTCTAWNVGGERRCQRVALAARRCQASGHRRIDQPLTAPEGGAVVSLGVSVGAVIYALPEILTYVFA